MLNIFIFYNLSSDINYMLLSLWFKPYYFFFKTTSRLFENQYTYRMQKVLIIFQLNDNFYWGIYIIYKIHAYMRALFFEILLIFIV